MKKLKRLMLVATAVCVFAFPYVDRAQQTETRIRLTENSDWWSNLRNVEDEYAGNPQEREVPASNFKIAGVALGEESFEQATRKLGGTTFVQRGDAAGGREQACYVSSANGQKIFLIFERGEVSERFYLFSGGKTWSGHELCAPSDKVSWKTSTVSGLRLGLTEGQVIAILGKPSLQRKNQLLYSLHATKKYTEEDLKTVRKNIPNSSEEELHRSYEYYDWSVGLDFKFEDSKLTFLAVSWAETN